MKSALWVATGRYAALWRATVGGMDKETEETENAPETPAQPLLTLRVSRDGGKSWEPEKVIRADDDLEPLMTSAWPPCRCPGCLPGRVREELDAYNARRRLQP